MRKLAITVAALLLLALIVSAVGCTAPEEEPVPTPMPTSTPISTLAPTPMPTPVTVSETWNITRMLSGLSITLTVVSWTGDEAVAEWQIHNQTGQAFEDTIRLSDIYPEGHSFVDTSAQFTFSR